MLDPGAAGNAPAAPNGAGGPSTVSSTSCIVSHCIASSGCERMKRRRSPHCGKINGEFRDASGSLFIHRTKSHAAVEVAVRATSPSSATGYSPRGLPPRIRSGLPNARLRTGAKHIRSLSAPRSSRVCSVNTTAPRTGSSGTLQSYLRLPNDDTAPEEDTLR